MNRAVRLLVPVDLMSVSWEHLEYAGKLAMRSGAVAEILYALPETSEFGTGQEEAARDSLLSILATLTERFASNGLSGQAQPVFVGFMRAGEPVALIIELANKGNHDAIVMGSNRRTAPSQSIVAQVTRFSNRPVLVIPDTELSDLAYDSRVDLP